MATNAYREFWLDNRTRAQPSGLVIAQPNGTVTAVTNIRSKITGEKLCGSWPMHPSDERIAADRKAGRATLANGLQEADRWLDKLQVTNRKVIREDLS